MDKMSGETLGFIVMELLVFLVEKGVLSKEDIETITGRAMDSFKKENDIL